MSEPCKIAQSQSRVRANPDRQRHLLRARSDGHRVPPAPSQRALKTREETMRGISRSPALKPKSATQSGQKTITSTPNIILDRCSRIQKERKSILRTPSVLTPAPQGRARAWYRWSTPEVRQYRSKSTTSCWRGIDAGLRGRGYPLWKVLRSWRIGPYRRAWTRVNRHLSVPGCGLPRLSLVRSLVDTSGAPLSRRPQRR
jgi:hypothetical protein